MDKAVVKKSAEAEYLEHDWGELHWFAAGRFGNSDEMTFGKCVLRPGCGNPPHSHSNCEEILHVLSGYIRHYVDGQGDVEMVPGDTITIPPNIRHSAENVGDEDAHLMIAFSSPERETKGE